MPTHEKLKTWSNDLQKMPPGRLMLYLFMAGSALLFITLVFAHAALTEFRLFTGTYSRLPRAFVFSTGVLSIGVSGFRSLRRYFTRGSLYPLLRCLLWVMAGGLLFTVLQIWGWYGLYRLNQTDPFLHREWVLIGLVSALHLLHLSAALAVLGYHIVYFYRKTQDPAEELIVMADPYYYERIRTLALFWYYTDLIWIFLFLYFLSAL